MLILSIILGVLQIIGGVCMFFVPISTFGVSGYFIIGLFYIYGIFGVVRAIHEKRYRKEFAFALLSLVLGVLGMVIPGVAIMNNFIILYMIAGWLFVRAILSFVNAYTFWKSGIGGTNVIAMSILLGVLDLICAIISLRDPLALAAVLGILIGVYFIETGINTIVTGITLNKIQESLR